MTVITNPPFSLFREYISIISRKCNKFCIIGNMNAITYKEVFPFIKNNKLWLGKNTVKKFVMPDGNIKQFGNILWYTNIDYNERYKDIVTNCNYAKEKYPRYDNYDAIEVSKVKEIPCDYNGIMGVPITYLLKHNPEQFEIIGATESEGTGFGDGIFDKDSSVKQATINNKKVYKRLFIGLCQKKYGRMIYVKDGKKTTTTKMNDGNPCYVDNSIENGYYISEEDDEVRYRRVYSRIFIKKLQTDS